MSDTEKLLEQEHFQSGAVEDTRPPELKEKDFLFHEMVASAAPVEWVEKAMAKLRKFPIFFQNGSGSCVAQTLKKIIGVLYWLKLGKFITFSATHIYQRRTNKPQSGMIGVEAFDIVRKGGVTLEEFVPSEGMTDAQMDGLPIIELFIKIGETFKILNFVVLPSKDFDVAASTIQKTGKAIMMWFYFLYSEWDEAPSIKVANLPERPTDDYPGVCRHSVSGTDTTLIGASNLPSRPELKGKQSIFMEDSWGASTAIEGRRFITREFYEKRNIFAAYPISFQYEDQTQNDQPVKPDPNKPKYKFTASMTFSPKFNVNKDVIALQNILKYEGVFAKNIDSTGYYGAITRNAVLAYKKKYGLAGDGMVVDKGMIEHLNSRYS